MRSLQRTGLAWLEGGLRVEGRSVRLQLRFKGIHLRLMHDGRLQGVVRFFGQDPSRDKESHKRNIDASEDEQRDHRDPDIRNGHTRLESPTTPEPEPPECSACRRSRWGLYHGLAAPFHVCSAFIT